MHPGCPPWQQLAQASRPVPHGTPFLEAIARHHLGRARCARQIEVGHTAMTGHDVATIQQIVELELHIPGAHALVGHGIHCGVGWQGHGIAGIGEPGTDIVQPPAQTEAVAQCLGHP